MKNIAIAALIILAAALSRLLPHPANFTPLAAMALAGGVYLDRRFALAIPLVALFLSDAILGFHNLMLYVYGSFLLVGLIGLWLRHRKSVLTVAGGALASSVLFFLVTNFGVWLGGDGAIYPRNLAGLMECYTLAIPFFRNTVAGDLVYTAAVFGAFELAHRWTGAFAMQPNPVEHDTRG